MIVISDTTPIISLMKAEQLDLLQKLFDVVYIPNAVYRELTENPIYSDETLIVRKREFILTEKVINEKSVTTLRDFTGLDVGESEAIVLADERQADLLLVDEHRGRQVAKKLGLTITGTIGVLAQAFDEGMLTKENVEECIIRLKENDIWISEKLYQKLKEHINSIGI